MLIVSKPAICLVSHIFSIVISIIITTATTDDDISYHHVCATQLYFKLIAQPIYIVLFKYGSMGWS